MRTISFSPPDITGAEINEVAEALKSGWITTGKRTKLFEQQIAEYVGTKKAVCLNSQTAAAEMTLRILGIGPNDEVIVPAYTYTASASVIDHVGAKIVMLDVGRDSFEIDYDAIEAAITENTKAIIPVDVGGCMCDYDRIREIVMKKKNIFRPANDYQKAIGHVIIIADSAHGFGAARDGKKSGTMADFTTFSFHAVKNLTTGEGGAVTWREIEGMDSDELYKQYMLFSLHGQTKDAFAKSQLGSWEYDILLPAYKCNMTDIQAAIGLKQLERYATLLERRKEIIKRFDEAFKPFGVKVIPHYDAPNTSSGHLYLMRIPGIDSTKRNEIIIRMAEMGVACNVHYKPLPMLTAYKNLGFDIADYPNAYHQFENEISLPLHTCLSDDDVDYIIECMVGILEGCTGKEQ